MLDIFPFHYWCYNYVSREYLSSRTVYKPFYFINPLRATVFFLHPLKTRKPSVFWCFQGIWKKTSGMKWVNEVNVTVFVYLLLTLNKSWVLFTGNISAGIFLLQINNGNIRIMHEICFKVNNKNARKTSLTSFLSLLLTLKKNYVIVLVLLSDFEQVNVWWDFSVCWYKWSHQISTGSK